MSYARFTTVTTVPNGRGVALMTEGWPGDPLRRAAAVAAWGLGTGADGQAAGIERLVRDDSDPRVRAAALAALVRRTPSATLAVWRAAIADDDPAVRSRACEVAPAVLTSHAEPAGTPSGGPAGGELVAALDDPASLVAEAAAFALGELGDHPGAEAVPALVRAARDHPDALIREAAVAALGSLGDPDGLPAVLGACTDKPAVRRRAVLALAAFEGPEVEAALQRALGDRDWQVRQAAEDLIS